MAENNNELTVKYNWKNPEGKDELIQLDATTIRRFIATGGNPTDEEVYDFMQLCKYMRYNPMIKEAYLIKYGTQPANIIVSKDLFAKRAEPHPKYIGYTIKDNYKELLPRLLSGDHNAIWELEVEVNMWRSDRKFPNTVVVNYIEYVGLKKDFNTGKKVPNSMWSYPGGKPRTMLRKVGVAQGYRATFPNLLTGYVEEELAKDHDDNMDIPLKNVTFEKDNYIINKETGEVAEGKADADAFQCAMQIKLNETKGKEIKEKVVTEEEVDELEEESERINRQYEIDNTPLKRINVSDDEPLIEGDVGAEQEAKKRERDEEEELVDPIVTAEDMKEFSKDSLDIDEGVDEYMYALTKRQYANLESIQKSRYLPPKKAGDLKKKLDAKDVNLKEYKEIITWFWGRKSKNIMGYRNKQITLQQLNNKNKEVK